MKAMAIVPAAVAAILALYIPAASSQQGCTQEYQACMTSCAGRPKPVQDTCFQNCEGKNDFCSEKIYGKRPMANPAAAAAEARGPAKDANARGRGQDGSREQVVDDRASAPQGSAMQGPAKR